MQTLLIKQAQIVNEGKIIVADVLVKGTYIDKIADNIDANADVVIDGAGKFLLPGMIDDQVHFREPGLTHKASIGTESRAAVAGGITSFMEMPNTVPPTFTLERLEEKMTIAKQHSLANYSFYLGASNDNIEEIKKLKPTSACGVKIFMGSSTGNLLVEDEHILTEI